MPETDPPAVSYRKALKNLGAAQRDANSDRDQFGELAHMIVRWLEKYPDVGDITRENYVAGKLASVYRQAASDCLNTAMRFAFAVWRQEEQ